MDDSLITATLRDHVRHVVTSLLRPDELDSWAFRIEDEEGAGRRNLWVDVVAKGEPYAGYLWHEATTERPEDGLGVFTDGLEDFISESRFAWGDRRELTDRPWESPAPAGGSGTAE